MKQSVFHAGAINFDEVGQLKAAFKATSGDPAMQIGFFLILLVILFAANNQHLIMNRNIDIFFAKSGHRHGNAVTFLAMFFDIIGWPV